MRSVAIREHRTACGARLPFCAGHAPLCGMVCGRHDGARDVVAGQRAAQSIRLSISQLTASVLRLGVMEHTPARFVCIHSPTLATRPRPFLLQLGALQSHDADAHTAFAITRAGCPPCDLRQQQTSRRPRHPLRHGERTQTQTQTQRWLATRSSRGSTT